MSKSIHSQIMEKIVDMPDDEVFTVSDFSEITGNKTASKVLDRICSGTAKEVRKLFRGIFWKKSGVITLKHSPEPAKIAFALARENKWKIAPCGKTAAYLMGLIKEPPSEWTFVTDGTYRRYKLPGVTISFKHTGGKLLNGLSEKTALLVHTIKEYGEAHVPEELRAWASKLTKAEKELILKETRMITDWISRSIKKLLS